MSGTNTSAAWSGYAPGTGRIFMRNLSNPPITLSNLPTTIVGEPVAWIEGIYDGATSYVSNGSVIARPTMTLSVDKTSISANGTDTATVSGIPSGATVAIDGGTAQAVSGTTETITATVPGTYTLLISCWPYLDSTVTITAS